MLGGTFTDITALCLVEASKCLQIVCTNLLPNIRSIPIMNTQLDLITVFPFGVDHQALNVSRD